MKKIMIIVIGLAVTLGAFSQENTSEQITVPLSKSGERAWIEFDHMNGNISVEAYSGKEIIINVTSSGYTSDHHDCDGCYNKHKDKEKNKTKGVPPGMKRIDVSPLELKASESNNVVKISSESWKRRMNIEIKTPSNTDLKLSNVHGAIEVKNLNGIMEISGVNSSISLQNISGSVLANTVNGDIEVTFKEIADDEPMSFVTLNGDLDVTIPSDTKATAKLRSDRGEIYTDFDMDMEGSKTDVKKENGEYEVSINSWVYGKINGGGSEFTFKNMMGSIIVRKGE
ncbi:MAG: DUF4097 family beta strand repeat protein [Cyclobacteriaceae bacterium]